MSSPFQHQNWFAGPYRVFLAFDRPCPTRPDDYPAVVYGEVPSGSDCLSAWGEVLSSLGWCRVRREPSGPHAVTLVLTPRSRMDDVDSWRVAVDGPGAPPDSEPVFDQIRHTHVNRLAALRERFVALDAAASPLYLAPAPASGSSRLLVVAPRVRAEVLHRVAAGETSLDFVATIPRYNGATLPFDGLAWLGGVFLQIRAERSLGGARVRVLEVPLRSPDVTEAPAPASAPFVQWYRRLRAFGPGVSRVRPLPMAARGPLPGDAVACVELWGEVLRSLGWCAVRFDPIDEETVALVSTPLTRWDHEHRQSFPLNQGGRGIVDRVRDHHVHHLLREREVFGALDAAPSSLQLLTVRDPVAGRGLDHQGWVLVSPAARRRVLARVASGESRLAFPAHLAPSSRVALPFEGGAFGFGVLMRVRVERAGRRAVVQVLEVVDHLQSDRTGRRTASTVGGLHGRSRGR